MKKVIISDDRDNIISEQDVPDDDELIEALKNCVPGDGSILREMQNNIPNLEIVSIEIVDPETEFDLDEDEL